MKFSTYRKLNTNMLIEQSTPQDNTDIVLGTMSITNLPHLGHLTLVKSVLECSEMNNIRGVIYVINENQTNTSRYVEYLESNFPGVSFKEIDQIDNIYNILFAEHLHPKVLIAGTSTISETCNMRTRLQTDDNILLMHIDTKQFDKQISEAIETGDIVKVSSLAICDESMIHTIMDRE